MLEVWTYIEPHIFEIVTGIGMILAVLLGKNKTAEQIASIRARKTEKAEKKANKAVKKAQTAVEYAEQLKKE